MVYLRNNSRDKLIILVLKIVAVFIKLKGLLKTLLFFISKAILIQFLLITLICYNLFIKYLLRSYIAILIIFRYFRIFNRR